MLILFELALQIFMFQRIAILPFHKLFHSLCSNILVYFYKHHNFLKRIIVLFVPKLHRILLNSGKSVESLKPKQKWKMKEFKKKENGHFHDFCSSTLPNQGEGILPTFAMRRTQTDGSTDKIYKLTLELRGRNQILVPLFPI